MGIRDGACDAAVDEGHRVVGGHAELAIHRAALEVRIAKILLAEPLILAFCAVAQILIDKTKLTPARILVCYVCVGVLLSAVGVYKPIVDFAGAGATVPLTGFGHVLATGVKKAIAEQGVIGILTGGLSGAAAGIAAAMVFGFAVALIAPSRPK